jgi:hypothetical protein
MEMSKKIHAGDSLPVKARFALTRIIRPVDSDGAWSFRFLVAAGMKIRHEIIYFRLFQDVCEGRHLLTAVKYLCAYLGFASAATYLGEVGAPVAATIIVDGVAVLAAATCINGRSPAFSS